MIKIDYCYYTLKHKLATKKPRQGALLRVYFSEGLIGYADCHPWPELGDRPIDKQLADLKELQITSQMSCSLSFARMDAEARKKSKSLLVNSKVPLSHFLIMDLLSCNAEILDSILSQGYTHVKIKMGENLPEEIPQLINLFSDVPLKIRLDFNEKLSPREYIAFLGAIHKIIGSIDYVEDPFPFEPVLWKDLQRQTRVPLACDRKAREAINWPESFSFLIVKPAIHSIDHFERVSNDKLIITSYLDHPLGQVTAAFIAAQTDRDRANVHGLLSHHVYVPTSFSQFLSQKGPGFVIPSGLGFGYDELFAEMKWDSLYER